MEMHMQVHHARIQHKQQAASCNRCMIHVFLVKRSQTGLHDVLPCLTTVVTPLALRVSHTVYKNIYAGLLQVDIIGGFMVLDE